MFDNNFTMRRAFLPRTLEELPRAHGFNLEHDGSRTLDIERSRSGLPCLWECGGAYTNTGFSQIIADHNGYPKHAICVLSHGDLACKNHALIPVHVDDLVITVERSRDKVAITVERIYAIGIDTAELKPCTDVICTDAINAAIEKADDYHCRKPHYIKNKEDN